MLAIVRKNGEAGDGAAIFVVEAVVVGEEAFGEVTFLATLHFDVDVHPVFAAVVGGNLDEFVEETLAEFGIFDDLGKFLIKEGVTAVPVDLPMRVGKVELDELRKVARDGVFPGGVVIVVGDGGFGWRVQGEGVKLK